MGDLWGLGLGLGITKWTLECSCVPKRIGATFCSNTVPFFLCGLTTGPRLGLRIKKWTLECSCVPKGVGATFCSKTTPAFSCGYTKPFGP